MSFEVRGVDGVHDMLGQWMEPKLTKKLQVATKEGASVLKAPVKAEAAKVSKRLARSVSVRKARKNRPATIVVFRPSIAFFRHWILRGTKDHAARKGAFLSFIPNWNPYFQGSPPSGASQVRTRSVQGMKADPIMDRIAERHALQVYDAMGKSLDKDI